MIEGPNVQRTPANPMFQPLLGRRTSLDQVIGEATARIAEIGRWKPANAFRSVKKDRVSVTKRYFNLKPADSPKERLLSDKAH